MRLFYTKTGRARYISHLDVMRTFQRAFSRTKLDFWYTEGFHPHLYLTFALPLSLGYESLYETVDFRITHHIDENELLEKIKLNLPEGFNAIKCSKPIMKSSSIKYANYNISFSSNDLNLIEKWNQCFSRDKIIVNKKTKHGEELIDIKPFISFKDFLYDGIEYKADIRLASGDEMNINPELLITSFKELYPNCISEIKVIRTSVLNDKFQEFC